MLIVGLTSSALGIFAAPPHVNILYSIWTPIRTRVLYIPLLSLVNGVLNGIFARSLTTFPERALNSKAFTLILQ